MGKQYLVLKVAEHIGQALSLIALPGLWTLEAAEEVVRDMMTAEPGSKLLIQEVGAA